MDNKGTNMPQPELFKNQALTSDAEAKMQTSVPDVEAGAAPGSAPSTVQESKQIPVVALRAGFYAQQRKSAGDKFEIRHEDDLGDWMAHADHRDEAKRRKKEADQAAQAKKDKLAGK